ncbi:MAG: ArsR/SmtB family transcription factor [Solirubrobacterales bacterium]
MNVPDALNHPMRRRILRMLIESGDAKSASEIVAAGLPEASVSVIAYHARVLEGGGMVSYGAVGPDAAEPTYRFAPSAAEDPEVIALLEATRGTDVTDG